jgi:diacylglycerol kinase family enzyme
MDRADGVAKARRAVTEGVELILIVGGDGTFNSIGAALLGSDVCVGIIPTGSGNGLARHFEIPLNPEQAIATLAKGTVTKIDVGMVNRHPFFVTCSLAWDAAIVKALSQSPVRGILPYVFAGAYEFFEYQPQRIRIELDGGERLVLPDPMVCTIANLTQYGGGAVIAPRARPDDGRLELVLVRRQDVPLFLANFGKVLRGAIHEIPKVVCRSFQHMKAGRLNPTPIQIDGELLDAPEQIEITVHPRCLKLLVPSAHPQRGRSALQ